MASVWGTPIPDKPAFQYWKCSDCPWTCDLTNPKDPQKREAEAVARFKKHHCAEYNAVVRRTRFVQPERQIRRDTQIRSASTDRADRTKTLESEARARSLWLELYDSRADHEEIEDAACDLHSSRLARVVREIYRLAHPK